MIIGKNNVLTTINITLTMLNPVSVTAFKTSMTLGKTNFNSKHATINAKTIFIGYTNSLMSQPVLPVYVATILGIITAIMTITTHIQKKFIR